MTAERPFLGLVGGAAQWLFLRGDVVSLTVSAAAGLAEQPRRVHVGGRLEPGEGRPEKVDSASRGPGRLVGHDDERPLSKRWVRG